MTYHMGKSVVEFVAKFYKCVAKVGAIAAPSTSGSP
jgi:hypothetical protein